MIRDFFELEESQKREVFFRVLEAAKKADEKFEFLNWICEDAEPGFPLTVKDNISTKGVPTTAGSKILKNYIPVFDATAVSRLKTAGFSVIGKAAMDEFGFGSFNTNTFRVPKNPWDPERSCGGSSGGSACAAALLEPHVSLAESTGGSISCPAAFCGVVGFTPSYGSVSRYGLIDYSNSLDKIGVVARTAEDAAFVFSLIAGEDGKDPTAVSIRRSRKKDRFVIGVPKEYMEVSDPAVARRVEDALNDLESEGHEIVRVSLPSTELALPAYYVIAMCEASTNLAKFCGMRYGLSGPKKENYNEYFSKIRAMGFGEEAKRRIILGTFARMKGYRGKYYEKALAVRKLVIDEFERVFSSVDVLCAPTMPFVAKKFSEIERMEPVEHYASDVLTVPPNLAGLPHVSVPCGFVKGLPIGLHIIGRRFAEEEVLRLASEFEKLRGPIRYPSEKVL